MLHVIHAHVLVTLQTSNGWSRLTSFSAYGIYHSAGHRESIQNMFLEDMSEWVKEQIMIIIARASIIIKL